MAWAISSGAATATEMMSPVVERVTLADLQARPLTEIPGIGPRIEASLEQLGIVSLADLVSHYPSRHEDLSNVKRISE